MMKTRPFLLLAVAFMTGGSLTGLTAAAYADGAPKKTAEVLARGKASFTTNCVACHGETGQGDGAGAVALDPKPRNFKTEAFKFGSKLEEVFSTLGKGSPGTAMVAFLHLPDEERWALAYHVLALKGEGGPTAPPPAPARPGKHKGRK